MSYLFTAMILGINAIWKPVSLLLFMSILTARVSAHGFTETVACQDVHAQAKQWFYLLVDFGSQAAAVYDRPCRAVCKAE